MKKNRFPKRKFDVAHNSDAIITKETVHCSQTKTGNSRGIETKETVPLSSPDLAFLYSPFGSRCSTTLSGASMNTSMNGMSAAAWMDRAKSLSAR